MASVISAWELAIKRGIGKLNLPVDIEKVVGYSGYRPIGIDTAHCQAYGDLPLREDHRDPFNRMLVNCLSLYSYLLLLILILSRNQVSHLFNGNCKKEQTNELTPFTYLKQFDSPVIINSGYR